MNVMPEVRGRVDCQQQGRLSQLLRVTRRAARFKRPQTNPWISRLLAGSQ